MTLTDAEIHERSIVRIFDSRELAKLLTSTVYAELDLPDDRGCLTRVAVTFEDEREGLPGQLVNMRAVVEICQALTAKETIS